VLRLWSLKTPRIQKNSPQPQNATQPEGCVDLDHVAKYVRLNASALLDPDSLFIPLALPNSETMRTLIDSGSSHCFVDSSFVSNQKITTTTIPSVGLRLFDGTCNSVITQTAELPISFLTEQSSI